MTSYQQATIWGQHASSLKDPPNKSVENTIIIVAILQQELEREYCILFLVYNHSHGQSNSHSSLYATTHYCCITTLVWASTLYCPLNKLYVLLLLVHKPRLCPPLFCVYLALAWKKGWWHYYDYLFLLFFLSFSSYQHIFKNDGSNSGWLPSYISTVSTANAAHPKP